MELMRSGKFQLGCLNSKRLVVNPDTGVYHFNVPAQAAQRVCNYVTQPSNRSPSGHLFLAGRAFPGYENYKGTESASAHDAKLQSTFTSAIPPNMVQVVVDCVPGLKEVVRHVSLEIGTSDHNLHIIHFLLQSNPVAVFSWHSDAYDLRMPTRMVTAIVSLNEVPSCMEMWGFKPAWYSGVGAALAFPGGARHRSVRGGSVSEDHTTVIDELQVRKGPVKLALFFTP